MLKTKKEPFNQNQKSKNFWQKLKAWQKTGIIFLALLLIYIVIIPLLFCTNMDFDFSKNPEYISCSQDSDCNAKTCGCLNEEGAKKFSLWSAFCGISLKCKVPSSCVCQNGQCVSNFDYGNDTQEEVILITDKTEYSFGEIIKINIQNNRPENVTFDIISLEVNKNNKWETIVNGAHCMSEKPPYPIKANSGYGFSWDQKTGLVDMKLPFGERLRYKIVYWPGSFDPLRSVRMFCYSNEFIIKDNFTENKELDYCQEDDECKVHFSHCDCQYHCVNKDAEIEV